MAEQTTVPVPDPAREERERWEDQNCPHGSGHPSPRGFPDADQEATILCGSCLDDLFRTLRHLRALVENCPTCAPEYYGLNEQDREG